MAENGGRRTADGVGYGTVPDNGKGRDKGALMRALKNECVAVARR